MEHGEFDEFDEPIPDFDEIIKIAKHMFTIAMNELTPNVSQVAVEQLRAALRDHLIAVGCDPHNEENLKSAVIGALVAIHTQINYTQIGTITAMVPAAAINMIKDPVQSNETIGWRDIIKTLEPERPAVNNHWSLITFIERLLNLGRKREQS